MNNLQHLSSNLGRKPKWFPTKIEGTDSEEWFYGGRVEDIVNGHYQVSILIAKHFIDIHSLIDSSLILCPRI